MDLRDTMTNLAVRHARGVTPGMVIFTLATGAVTPRIEAGTDPDHAKQIMGVIEMDLPTVTLSEVRDLKTGSTTAMTFSNVAYNIKLTEDIFTERYLQRPPQEALR